MKGVTHVAIGAAIGHAVGQPLLGFIGGLGSHVIADMVPHKHMDMKLDLLASSSLTGAILFLVNSQTLLATSLGIIGSVLPDAEVVLWKLGLLKEDQLAFPSHTFLPHSESSPLTGSIGEITILSLSFVLLLI